MAIHNQVLLYAQATEAPKIIKKDNGDYVQGSINLTVAPGERQVDDVTNGKKSLFKVEFSKLPVLTGNPTIIAEMDKIKVGDIVMVKGNLVTKNVTKKKICPKCGTPYKKDGVLTFVNPIHFSIEKTDLTIEQGEMELKEYCEVSNLVTLIGTICKDPEVRASTKKSMIVSFPLAIDRKYYIATDNPENRTDYPYVQVYGKEKGNDVLNRCYTGTVLFIDGIIKTRKYKQMEYPCMNDDCDQMIEWNDWTIDVIPFALEYMANWRTDEDIAKKAEEFHNSLFSHPTSDVEDTEKSEKTE